MKKTVCVLMSTYNGENYLRRQIETIFSQDNIKVKLIIRDDESSDSTLDIINSYIEYGYDIELIKGKNVGPTESFLNLIYTVEDYDYYALADQDDVWYSNKLCIAANKLERYSGKPALYYSSVTLIDETEKIIDVQVDTKKATRDNVLFGFYATGCTIVYNLEFKKLILNYRPQKIYMHDAWLVTVACFFGKVVFDSESHIGYRQHSNNVVGMNKRRSLKNKILDFFITNKGRHSKVAAELLRGFSSCMQDKETVQLLSYASNCPKSLMACYGLLTSREMHSLHYSDKIKVVRQILFGVF